MQLRQLPNAICVLRLAMIPFLWLLALTAPEARLLFTALLGFAFLTDQFDGYLCRRYGLATSFGAKLDRVADDLLLLNVVAWVYVLRPELFREYWRVLVPLLIGLVTSTGLQYLRFRRKIPFHLHSGKLSNWVNGFFAAHVLLFGPAAWFVYLMAAFAAYALLEEIALVCTREDLDEHVTSVFARRLAPDARGEESD
ncbi:MAG: CDP-alcohol phosphatidyltransferase family protein [Armatimonadetes bacterium]|nr:CDP-alcohol phosphatidyltransferase family protein [Armatimonadota bacterium]